MSTLLDCPRSGEAGERCGTVVAMELLYNILLDCGVRQGPHCWTVLGQVRPVRGVGQLSPWNSYRLLGCGVRQGPHCWSVQGQVRSVRGLTGGTVVTMEYL